MVLAQISAPTQFWVALTAYEPGTDLDGTGLQDLEPYTDITGVTTNSTGYIRVSYGTGYTYWSDPADLGYSVNLGDIAFPIPVMPWGTLTHFALCSSVSVGNVYLYGEFDVPPSPDVDGPFVIPAGGIVINLGSQEPSIVPV